MYGATGAPGAAGSGDAGAAGVAAGVAGVEKVTGAAVAAGTAAAAGVATGVAGAATSVTVGAAVATGVGAGEAGTGAAVAAGVGTGVAGAAVAAGVAATGVSTGTVAFTATENAASRPHLVQLASPGNDISRSHVRVSLENWFVQVTDLGSTNGTVVTLPGQPPVRLRPHDPFTILPGTSVSIADEITLRYEASA